MLFDLALGRPGPLFQLCGPSALPRPFLALLLLAADVTVKPACVVALIASVASSEPAAVNKVEAKRCNAFRRVPRRTRRIVNVIQMDTGRTESLKGRIAPTAQAKTIPAWAGPL